MPKLVVTFTAPDRPGLVDSVSACIADHDGNWEVSQLGVYANLFVGTVLVDVRGENLDSLESDLRAIAEAEGLELSSTRASAATAAISDADEYTASIVSQDHPGIVQEVSHVFATSEVSIAEFSSEIVDAPMGGKMFTALINFRASDSKVDDLSDALETLSSDLMVEIDRS